MMGNTGERLKETEEERQTSHTQENKMTVWDSFQ